MNQAARDPSKQRANQRASSGQAPAAARARNPMIELHVIPDERTTIWRVFETDAAEPLSEHTSATEAELAARARAADHDAERVVVHDRYHRTHDAALSPAGVSAREQRARTPARACSRRRSPARPR